MSELKHLSFDQNHSVNVQFVSPATTGKSFYNLTDYCQKTQEFKLFNFLVPLEAGEKSIRNFFMGLEKH